MSYTIIFDGLLVYLKIYHTYSMQFISLSFLLAFYHLMCEEETSAFNIFMIRVQNWAAFL